MNGGKRSACVETTKALNNALETLKSLEKVSQGENAQLLISSLKKEIVQLLEEIRENLRGTKEPSRGSLQELVNKFPDKFTGRSKVILGKMQLLMKKRTLPEPTREPSEEPDVDNIQTGINETLRMGASISREVDRLEKKHKNEKIKLKEEVVGLTKEIAEVHGLVQDSVNSQSFQKKAIKTQNKTIQVQKKTIREQKKKIREQKKKERIHQKEVNGLREMLAKQYQEQQKTNRELNKKLAEHHRELDMLMKKVEKNTKKLFKNRRSVTYARFSKSVPKFRKCAVCEIECSKRCSACKSIYYCSEDCQRFDWENHKPICRTFTDSTETKERHDGSDEPNGGKDEDKPNVEKNDDENNDDENNDENLFEDLV